MCAASARSVTQLGAPTHTEMPPARHVQVDDTHAASQHHIQTSDMCCVWTRGVHFACAMIMEMGHVAKWRLREAWRRLLCRLTLLCCMQ